MSVPSIHPKDSLGNASRLSNGSQSKESRCASTTFGKPASPSPKRAHKFGNLLEVPNLENEGLQSYSTSVSTDEGIAMDDTSPQRSADCYATTETTEVIQL